MNSKSKYLIIALISFIILSALLTRFWRIDTRPVAHDESLFGYYAYMLSQGKGYKHTPMLHGPLLIEAEAIIFKLFGDSKWTMRLFPAICSLLLFPSLLLFRSWLGWSGILAASLLMLFSPTILFYSRFLRNDIVFLLLTCLSIGFIGLAFGKRKKKFIIPALLSLGLLPAIKENTVFIAFSLISFSILLFLMESKYFQKLLFLKEAAGKYCLKDTYSFCTKNLLYCFAGAIFSFGLLTIAYTIFFSENPETWQLVEETISYWWGQHIKQRLRGPYHYYWVLLLIYEMPLLLIIAFGLIKRIRNEKTLLKYALPVYIGTFLILYIINLSSSEGEFFTRLLTYKLPFLHMTSFTHLILAFSILYWGLFITINTMLEKEYFLSFCIFWAMSSILSYSYAGEKVPWLVLHLSLPLIILTAYFIKDTYEGILYKQNPKKKLILLSSFLAIFLVWNIKNSISSSITNDRYISEILVHNHTSKEAEELTEKILSNYIFSDVEERHNFLNIIGEVTWPMTWYFRKIPAVKWGKTENPERFRFVLKDLARGQEPDEGFIKIPLREHWQLSYIYPNYNWEGQAEALSWQYIKYFFNHKIPQNGPFNSKISIRYFQHISN